jgi:hypothetical protein
MGKKKKKSRRQEREDAGYTQTRLSLSKVM